MLAFCPSCGNLLMMERDVPNNKFSCRACPYVYYIEQKITFRVFPRLKEVDHIVGGAESWENVDSTDAVCPKCSYHRAYFTQMQTRSADEPMTIFYKCCQPTCGHTWRD
ncbi:DNA-directed RNA polymerase III subunit RPC10-like [Lutzomyia longipalpis]|uniref:DNA-directed RNA polymerase III subunit RPC10-like n=1 Tax=Lutzomyia longipalpis TaxID=7200 RepID=UPI0024844D8F|nr:DNA-directed RNA polymerase III subunit RPC10-like [Lutzomyia longipalpis]